MKSSATSIPPFARQLVQCSIEVAATEAQLRNQEEQQKLSITAIHLAYAAIQQRLALFATIVYVAPDVVQKLDHAIETKPGNPLCSEKEMVSCFTKT